jgi:hypothetical protein
MCWLNIPGLILDGGRLDLFEDESITLTLKLTPRDITVEC